MSLVALGRPNPQILNIDFLVNNKILPFEELPQQGKAVKKFVSVPGFANLVFENIEFIIDEGRFQITERSLSEWTENRILDIAKRYFKVLPYTPLKVVGVNLNSAISFQTSDEAIRLQELILPKDSLLPRIVSADTFTASTVLRYPYGTHGERATLTVEQPDKENTKRIVNFNIEFDFTDWEAFVNELDRISDVSNYADSIVEQLLGAI